MQQEFHFTVVYMLCRCAGFSPGESRIVAGASQFTDDCAFMGPIGRADGKPHVPAMTYPPGTLALDPGAQAAILRPFHFPGGGGRDAVVLPGNAAATSAAREAAALAGSSAPYGLHALGIALHALADSFSHQGFSPYARRVNTVPGLSLLPADERMLEDIQGFFLQKWAARLLSIGHAEAGYCPDIPFLKWTHRLPAPSAWARAGHAGVTIRDGWVVRDNSRIAAAAARAVASALAAVPGLKPRHDAGEAAAYFEPALFRKQSSLKGRARQWEEVFRSSPFFDFRTPEDAGNFVYDGKDWLGRACGLTARSRGPAVLAFRRGHRRTDWWKFQQAARWHARQMGVGAG